MFSWIGNPVAYIHKAYAVDTLWQHQLLMPVQPLSTQPAAQQHDVRNTYLLRFALGEQAAYPEGIGVTAQPRTSTLRPLQVAYARGGTHKVTQLSCRLRMQVTDLPEALYHTARSLPYGMRRSCSGLRTRKKCIHLASRLQAQPSFCAIILPAESSATPVLGGRPFSETCQKWSQEAHALFPSGSRAASAASLLCHHVSDRQLSAPLAR